MSPTPKTKSSFIFRILWSIIIIWIIALILLFLKRYNYINLSKMYSKLKNNFIKAKTGIIIEVDEKHEFLTIMSDDGSYSISNTIPFAPEGNIGFKPRQKILILYKGDTPIRTFDENRVKKIIILNQKSNFEIPNSIIEQYNYSKDKVLVSVKELTNTSITYHVIDNNDIPYNHKNTLTYKILEKNNDPESKEEFHERKISDISWVDTIVSLKEIDEHTFEKSYNWEKLYGSLDARRI